MIDVSNSFRSGSKVLGDFFCDPGVALYVPQYQRQYSWDTANIDQLLDDVVHGITSLADPQIQQKERVITYFGTFILVIDRSVQKNIPNLSPNAEPNKIYMIIDGQQRLTTLAMLACALYSEIHKYTKLSLVHQDTDISESIDFHLSNLTEFFAFDKKSGYPRLKPKLIRSGADYWVKGTEPGPYTPDEVDHSGYNSSIARFFAQFIQAVTTKSELPQPDGDSLLVTNYRHMISRLRALVAAPAQADNVDDDVVCLPSADEIIYLLDSKTSVLNPVKFWGGEQPTLAKLAQEHREMAQLVQLQAFAHYLFARCCVTVVEPTDESWAFEMFQSLNATGTPLTALETFKPQVVQQTMIDYGKYDGTAISRYFDEIESLFTGKNADAGAKKTATNQLLTLTAVTHNGTKLSTNFREQRGWLKNNYPDGIQTSGRERFIRNLRDLARFQAMHHDLSEDSIFRPESGLKHRQVEMARLCLAYLSEAGQHLARGVLSRFHAQMLRGGTDADDMAFLGAACAVAAFYTLWRSALPNNKLDKAYRRMMQQALSWEKHPQPIALATLKERLRAALEAENIHTLDQWKQKSLTYLRYDSNRVCVRFALLVTAHDTAPDHKLPGLMLPTVDGTSPYLTHEQWVSRDLATIEHVAPVRPEEQSAPWDPGLFKDDVYQRIGNLTLLPKNVNISASNRGWTEKWFYYRHIAEVNPESLQRLAEEAIDAGVFLKPATIELLRKAHYGSHIAPLTAVGPGDKWNRKLVEARTERICTILWERMWAWLN